MIFFNTFLAADTQSVPVTPTDCDDLTMFELSNGIFDYFYLSNRTNFDLIPEPYLEWDLDTVMFATFDDNTHAGNLKISRDDLSHFLVKRRRKGDFQWITIGVFEVPPKGVDPNFIGVDKTATILWTYEYALVPMINGMEGNYITTEATCECPSIVLIDNLETWVSPLTDGFLDMKSVVPNSVVETMYDVYPTIVRNTNANYETISVDTTFLPTDEHGCFLDDDDLTRIDWNRQVLAFLRNGKPKILKAPDSRIWLCYVTTPPEDKANDMYNYRVLTFEVTEVGDVNKESDLYYAGLIDVPEEYWVT